MKRFPSRTAVSVFWLALVLLCPTAALANAGKIVFASGQAYVLRQQQLPAQTGQVVETGDLLVTGMDGRVQLLMNDSSRIALRPNSRFRIDAFTAPDRSIKSSTPGSALRLRQVGRAFYSLIRGGFRTVTHSDGLRDLDSYQVRTPVATIGIRGTYYVARYCNNDCSASSQAKSALLQRNREQEIWLAFNRAGIKGDSIPQWAHYLLSALQGGGDPLFLAVKRDLRIPSLEVHVINQRGDPKRGITLFSERGNSDVKPGEFGHADANNPPQSGPTDTSGVFGRESDDPDISEEGGDWKGDAAGGADGDDDSDADDDESAYSGRRSPEDEDETPGVPEEGTGTSNPSADGTETFGENSEEGLTAQNNLSDKPEIPVTGTNTQTSQPEDLTDGSSGGVGGGAGTSGSGGQPGAGGAGGSGGTSGLGGAGGDPGTGGGGGGATGSGGTGGSVGTGGSGGSVGTGGAGGVAGSGGTGGVIATGGSGGTATGGTGGSVTPITGSTASSTSKGGFAQVRPGGSMTKDSSGNLQSFQGAGFDSAGVFSPSGTYQLNTPSAIVNTGQYDPLASGSVIRWGRWAGAAGASATYTPDSSTTATIPLQSQSIHWIYSESTTALPSTGTATYALVGNTNPTDNLGNVGVLGTATLNADFGNQIVDHAISLSVGGQTWNASSTGAPLNISNGTFGADYTSFSGTACSPGPCQGGFAGFFVGDGGAAGPPGAGISYGMENTNGDTVTGTAAFERSP